MALKKNDIQPVRQRKYLAKDFDGLRAQILDYVQTYYPNKLADFSESSMGGLFLDMAAYVGDNMSFYLDHQFGETNYETTVEIKNIEKHLRTAGVPITGAAPAVVPVTIYIEVPANFEGTGPRQDCLPIIKKGSIFSTGDVDFILLEDVDFSKRKSDNNLYASQKVGAKSSTNKITSYLLSYSGLCISGDEYTESFVIGSTFTPFRQITLSNQNVTEIINFDPRVKADKIIVDSYEHGIQIQCDITYVPYDISEYLQLRFDNRAGYLLPTINDYTEQRNY